jgi:hypothetical protein
MIVNVPEVTDGQNRWRWLVLGVIGIAQLMVMPGPDRDPRPAGGAMTELERLVRQLRELASRRDELRERSGSGSDLEAAERAIEQLRWRLAHVARRGANDEPGNAA